jgi:hypothetical protein
MGKSKPDIVELRPLDGRVEKVKLPALDYADRLGTLATVAKVIETGSLPPRFSSGKDNLASLALVQATIASANRGGEWVDIAEVME